MYIIELIIKRWEEKHNKRREKYKKNQQLSPDYNTCDHVFMPIDSTGKIFACSKCGEILKK